LLKIKSLSVATPWFVISQPKIRRTALHESPRLSVFRILFLRRAFAIGMSPLSDSLLTRVNVEEKSTGEVKDKCVNTVKTKESAIVIDPSVGNDEVGDRKP
jgi:hypothetical protein